VEGPFSVVPEPLFRDPMHDGAANPIAPQIYGEFILSIYWH